MPVNSSLYLCSVSVIIPCFNAKDWIIKAIKSVESQIFQPLEIIIVDDGSTDDSVPLIENYSCSIQLSVLTQTNNGPASARNYGVSKAIGDYIAFLDADDEWSEDRLSKQISHVDSSSFSTSDCYLIDEDSNIIGEHVNSFPISKDSIMKSLYLGRVSMLTPGLLIPRNKFLDVGGFDVSQRYKEDHLLILKLLSSGLSLNYLNEKLFKVRVHTGSGRNSIDENILKKSFFDFSDKAISESHSLAFYKKEFISEVFYILSKVYLGKNFLKAVKYAIKAFASYPSVKNAIIIFLSFLPINKEKAVMVKNVIKRNTIFNKE